MRKTSGKRTLCALLALVLLVCLSAAPAAAADMELTALEKAQALHDLGLFNGKGDPLPDGTPNYALEDTATRSEAATMLIRLLGKEGKANAQTATGALKYPFYDADWASANVAWLYEAGYTNGVSNTEFGGSQTITAQQFATLIMRSLGYTDGQDGFSYDTALTKAVEIGLLTSAQSSEWQGTFLRAGMAEMCYNALYCNMRMSKLTLLQKLTNDGVFKDSYNTSISALAPLNLTLKYAGGGHENTQIGKYYIQEGSTASPCGDVNGDGKPEIIFNVRTNYCLDAATGTVKWMCPSGHDVTERGAEPFGQNTNHVPAQIADLDGDGLNEIIIVSTTYAQPEYYSNTSVLTVYDGTGHFKFAPQYFKFRVHSMKIADLDGNGTKEIALGVGPGDFFPGTGEASVYVYNCDGSLRQGWPAECGYGLFNDTMEAVDLDGDGTLELVMLNDQEWISAYHHDGTQVVISSGPFAGKQWRDVTVWENSEFELEHNLSSSSRTDRRYRETSYSIGGTRGGVVAADIDGDGVQEMVYTAMILDNPTVHDNMNSGTGTTFTKTLKYFTTFILRLDHSRYTNPAKGFDWNQMPTDTGVWLTLEDYVNMPEPNAKPVVADLDLDGNMEILFASYDGKVHCFSLDGTEHGAWPFAVTPTRGGGVMNMPTRPAVGDLNGDGIPEIVIATYPNHSSTERGMLYILDYSGKVLAQRQLEPYWGTNGRTAAYNGSQGDPVIADVDNDGRNEIIVTTYTAGVCVYKVS